VQLCVERDDDRRRRRQQRSRHDGVRPPRKRSGRCRSSRDHSRPVLSRSHGIGRRGGVAATIAASDTCRAPDWVRSVSRRRRPG
jgi:hypothetical protein